MMGELSVVGVNTVSHGTVDLRVRAGLQPRVNALTVHSSWTSLERIDCLMTHLHSVDNPGL